MGQVMLYSQRQVALAAFIGTPAASAILMARNFRRFGKPEKSKTTIAIGIVVMLLEVLVAVFLPNGPFLGIIPFLAVAAVQIWYGKTQKDTYLQMLEQEANKAGSGEVIGMGLIWLIPICALLLILNTIFPDTTVTSNDPFAENTDMLIQCAQKGQLLKLRFEYFKRKQFGEIENNVLEKALAEAIQNNHFEVCKYLLAKEVNVNNKTYHMETPLNLAIWKADDIIVNYLLEQGADVNLAGYQEATALQWAAEQGRISVVKDLLDRGAQINSRNFSYAFQDDLDPDTELNIVKLFLDHGIQTEDISIHSAIGRGRRIEILKLFLERGADPNSRDGFWKPVLHEAVQYGSLEQVKVLLEAGADTEAIFKYETPLDLAIKKGRKDVEDLLRAYAAK